MSESGWPSEWLRGALTLLVLRTLVPGPTYGYAVASTLEEHGLGKVKGGTLYPLLARLEADGLIASRWEPGEGGPGRKYFSLTAPGRRHLDSEVRRWDEFSGLVAALLHDGTTPPTTMHDDTTGEPR